MAKIKATIGGVAYEINAVKGITANNTEINVPLTIEGEGGGVGGFTEYNEVSVNGSDFVQEVIPIATSSYQGYKVAHGLTVAPKLVIIKSNAPTDGSAKGVIMGGYLYSEGQNGYVSEGNVRKLGAFFQTNPNTGASLAAVAHYGTENNKVVGWSAFGMDATYFYFNKTATSNYNISPDLTYTFKFFA